MKILEAIQRLSNKGVDVPTHIASQIRTTLILMFIVVATELISIYHTLTGHVESATLKESLVIFSILITSMILIYFRKAIGIFFAFIIYGYHIVKAVVQQIYDFELLIWVMMIFINVMCHISIRISRYLDANPMVLMELKANNDQEHKD